MRIAACLVACLVASTVYASEPGQPLDCSDWVFLEPGITCREVRPCGAEPTTGQVDFPCQGAGGSSTDALGRIVGVELTETVVCNGSRPGSIELKTFDGVSEHLIAFVRGRCVAAACADGVEQWERGVDSVNGRVFAVIRQRSFNCPGSEYNQMTLFAFEGFPTLAQVIQSYAPTSASLSFRVPYMPEGMAGADHFDTYYGPLTHPVDFTQAQGLACHYPASAPAVGDYLEVADGLPDPAPGTGRYYVTAATHQGQTRYGRKTNGGVLTGRDPAVLPACTPK